jgi:mRNA-degrading endonuclease RelE of RelBE toxin-antitoxin system
MKTPYSRLLANAVEELEKSDNPAALGTRKHGSYSDAYSYEIGRSIRMIYRVDSAGGTIEFVAVGKS